MTFTRYKEAEYQLNQGLIRRGLSLSRCEVKPKDPAARMAEMHSFLDACGNPQQGIPAVHVGGTSGKGSTAAAVAGILTEAGLKVGLHISPYLQSATEKIWIADKFVSSDDFADLVNWVMPIAMPRVHPDTPASIHGMASVAIALEAFRREKVDVMVFEVGCGGRYDLTSFVDTRVAIITNVGLDHTISLGPTLMDIAWHKAGIARSGAPLITGARGPALEPIRAEASTVGAPLIEIPDPGDALSHNRDIAIRAATEMANVMNVALTVRCVDRGILRVRMAGRTEVMPKNGPGPKVILDGAHNAEKLAVAINAALDLAEPGPKVGIFGFLGTKAKPEILTSINGRFDHVIATEPHVYAKTPCPAEKTAEMLTELGYCPTIEPNVSKALDSAMTQAGPDGTVLITGSFYLVGEVRERWYPKKSVVEQRSSWPS
ncbi:MAG: Mur ligase family protein [Myxococcota bacterium]|nr:Mur ligase family protein [Myxococcota bacterium]